MSKLQFYGLLAWLLAGTVPLSADTIGDMLPFLTGIPERRVVSTGDSASLTPLSLLSGRSVKKGRQDYPGWRTDTYTVGYVSEDLLRIKQGNRNKARWSGKTLKAACTLSRQMTSGLQVIQVAVKKKSPSLTINGPQKIWSDSDEKMFNNIDITAAVRRKKASFGLGYRLRDRSDNGRTQYRWYRSENASFNQYLYEPMTEFFGNMFLLNSGENSSRVILESRYVLHSGVAVEALWMRQNGDISCSAGYFNSARNRNEELAVPGFWERKVRGLKVVIPRTDRLQPHLMYIRSKISTRLGFLPGGADPLTEVMDYGHLAFNGNGEIWGGGADYTAGKRTRWWGSYAQSRFHYRTDLRLSTPVLGYFLLFVPITHRARAVADIEMPFDVYQLGVEQKVSPRLSYRFALDYLIGDYQGEAHGETQLVAGLQSETLEDRRNLADLGLITARLTVTYELTRTVTLRLGVTQYAPTTPTWVNPDEPQPPSSPSPAETPDEDEEESRGGRVLEMALTYRF